MKVLIDGGNSGSGGYLRYLSGILGSGALEGIEVLLVCSPKLAERLDPLDPEVTVRTEGELDSPRRWVRLAWWPRAWPRIVSHFQPDVVLHPTGLLRGRSGDVPRVAIHHSMAPFSFSTYRLYGLSKMSAELAFWRTRLVHSFRRADGIIFHAEYTRDVVLRQVGRTCRSTLVPNAVPAPFVAAPARDNTALPDPVRVLYVSTLHLFKHQPQVVTAVAALRRELGLDLHLEFVGGGEPRARSKLDLSIRENDATTWTTIRELDAAETPQAYLRSDVFVFSSSVETWSITLLEAMASGLPIACSDRMAMPEMLRDAGVYFDPEDPASIADALRPLLTDADLRQRCGTLARQYAAEYTWERSAAGVRDFLRHVVTEESR